jgi:hypothetical protein
MENNPRTYPAPGLLWKIFRDSIIVEKIFKNLAYCGKFS